ncbi:hypothetical protein J5X84_33010 [Streptosporangiaceae bacterium NEAU-GS5]|nr:hypothetical protein [Streptosporangiaceae bacterium NEAU-GS5]
MLDDAQNLHSDQADAESSGDIPLWLAVAFTLAVILGTSFGVLGYLATGNVAGAVLTGLTALAASFVCLLRLIKR